MCRETFCTKVLDGKKRKGGCACEQSWRTTKGRRHSKTWRLCVLYIYRANIYNINNLHLTFAQFD